MLERILVNKHELAKSSETEKLSDLSKTLLDQQKESWELCKSNYNALKDVKVKLFDFGEFTIKVQFNPGRVTSSTAKVDPKTIKERKCFLCVKNLPEDQKGILFRDKYVVLTNPFPIFTEHFTIPHVEHVPQDIKAAFEDFLLLSKEIGDKYSIFYNGPKCGASAPDHLHFQAGEKDFMPIDHEYDMIKDRLGKLVYDKNNLKVYAIDNYLRKVIGFESNDIRVLVKAFDAFYEIFKSSEEEPMMNIVCKYDEGWKVLVMPRRKHRPDCFFAQDDTNITISPASVDFGGVMITPFEKDFNKITKEDIAMIFSEVSLDNPGFEKLVCQTIDNI